MKRSLFFVLAAFITISVNAVDPMGYIVSKNTAEKSLDTISIPVYDKINGKVIGNCKLTPYTFEDGSGFIISDLSGRKFPSYRYPLGPLKDKSNYSKKFIKTNSTDRCEYYANGYGLNNHSLVYYEKKGDYLKILANTLDSGAWIKIDENLFRPLEWINELLGNFYGPYVWGYENYRLRAAPSKESEVITKLSSIDHKIIQYIRREGNWIEIRVCLLKPGMEKVCEEVNTDTDCIEVYQGWIRIVDGNGMPEDIWFDTSC